MSKEKTNSYNIYLIKENISKEDIIKKEKKKIFKSIEISETMSLYILSSTKKKPDWFRYFDNYLKSVESSIFSASSGALLIIYVKSRYFAVSFGTGQFHLDRDQIEERFGLITTLNIVNDEKVKSIDKKTFDSIIKQSREQSTKEIKSYDFGIDIASDLLKSLTGVPNKVEDYGKNISGADSLNLKVKKEIKDLPEFLVSVLEDYKKTDYKEKFPWVDHISEFKNQKTIRILNAELIKYINQKKWGKVWLAIPEIVDWNYVNGFKFISTNSNLEISDINLEDYLTVLNYKNKTLTLDGLKKDLVFALNNENVLIKKWSVFKCMFCEVGYNDDTYILTDGKWYKIKKSYVEEINKRFKEIKKCKLDFLKPCHGNETEKKYSERIVKDNSKLACLMDSKVIQIEGKSKIEFCDIYTNEKQIIHIKKYGASAVLGHLFNQGFVSGNSLLSPEIRNKINLKLDKEFTLTSDEKNNFSANNYEIIFAIISSEEADSLSLPFFSKIVLCEVNEKLSNLGYQTSYTKVTWEKEKRDK